MRPRGRSGTLPGRVGRSCIAGDRGRRRRHRRRLRDRSGPAVSPRPATGGAVELLHSFQTPAFAEALNIVYNLPDGLSREEVEQHLQGRFHLVYALMTTWESLGILVHMGEVDLELVDDFFSGPITVSWRKLKGHVLGERAMLGRDTIEEWFQWLNERMEERESRAAVIPAYVEHRDWRPKH